MMRHSNLFGSSEEFDRTYVNLLQVDAAHAKDFLTDVVSFLVDTRNFNNLIWCEKGEDRGCRPDAKVVENGLLFL